ncbi:MAG: hypothetical protein PQ612_06010 [Rickettsiales bacterium]|nr:hypothetical protein [Pseudomonadota bacterium]MDA0966878.1 hypothetical protein [Pseudomonadota bacterium]MDG4543553.1 hypothetical protein [Rickettsiales bacterium]MDG4545701.1 hypothetical protein [Rickettsiales bacterium]MDG4547526.1 hypothetical protein [Rickettsiales bacterium]
MTYAKKHIVEIVTNSSGDAVAYTEKPLNGKIINAIYDKTDFADGVDFTITSETTGQNIWTESNVNASKTISPKQPVHDTAGVAALYASGGEAVLHEIYVVDERIKCVIANGGDTKTGTITFIEG